MLIEWYKKIYYLQILLMCLIFFACPGDITEPEEPLPISNLQFTFLQDINELYFSADVDDSYNSTLLSDVMLLWYGSNQSNTADSLSLVDNGTNGDIILNDGTFTIKVSNDSSVIMNVLGDDSGKVYIDVIASYGFEQISLSDSFQVGNIIPRIISVTAPDSITRPEGNTLSLHVISAEVFDADGLESIRWVGFTSFHVDGDSVMNNGNYIYLYDDGSEDILYEPDFTSGDSIRGDGIYSFRIPVYGIGSLDSNLQTKTGNFLWRFIAQDKSDEYSKITEHEVFID